MATFRKVHVQFWGDPFIQELTPEQKFFYLYLLTNDKTKQCGIYEITKRQICYDTGYNIDTVSKLLRYCIDTDKIKYNAETNELAIKNWNKYNGSDSPKVKTLVNQELKSVKDTVLIEYLYGMDNVEILNRNKNKKENRKEEEIEKEKSFTIQVWRKDCSSFLKDQKWIETFCMAKNLKQADLEKSMNEFVIKLNLQEDYKDVAGLKKHYTNHYNKYGLVVSEMESKSASADPTKVKIKV